MRSAEAEIGIDERRASQRCDDAAQRRLGVRSRLAPGRENPIRSEPLMADGGSGLLFTAEITPALDMLW